MEQVRDLFPRASNGIYLNTASMALGNTRGVQAMKEAADRWQQGAFEWQQAEVVLEQLRARVSRLLGTESDNLAFVTGVSGGAGTVAAQLPDGGGTANIVVPARDFSSNFIPWSRLADRGYEVRMVDDLDGELHSDQFAEAIDVDTRLIATSSVQSVSGFKVDLDALKTLAAEANAWLVVDASQAFGSIRVGVEGIHALFSCSHKWLLGIRGMGYLYVDPRLTETFEPITPGWKATADPSTNFYGPTIELATTAAKLDVSSPWFDPAANLAGIGIIDEIGIDAIEAHNMSLVDHLESAALTVPFEPANRSPIVSLELADQESAIEALNAIGAKASLRGGRLRIGMHLYNTLDEMDAVIEAIT